MSTEDKERAVGRAHLSLRDAKSALAASKTVLMEYSECLENTHSLVKKFISDPLQKNDSYTPLKEQLKSQIHDLFVATLDEQIDELEFTTRKVNELEEQIRHF